jgi:hypothetical protein
MTLLAAVIAIRSCQQHRLFNDPLPYLNVRIDWRILKNYDEQRILG